MTEKEIIEDDAKIGKDVIESLTLGMYEDCRFIFREYIQNAADQVDKAVKMSLLEKGADEIHIQIDRDKRIITVEDNATGIPQNRVMPILRNVAHSTKTRGVDKGFRGIGRLGGLGYCSKLIFVTSYAGEDVKSIMTWDADLLKLIINDRDNDAEAKDVLMAVTDIRTEKEEISEHYFKVILEDITSDDLLDIDGVRDYLSMVAPVDIDSKFIYRNKINQYMKEHGLTVDTYNIFINGEQIYKPYTNYIYEDNHGGKKQVDDILGVEFLMGKDQNDNIIYWGWYSLSRLNGQMKPKNIARGIRLRKENIQIGDEEICKKFFSKTEDQRFSFYYFGEIHAVSKDLIPNSRRDYFGENSACTAFERRIKDDFLKLKDICYQAQKIRSSAKVLAKGDELRQTIQTKNKTGYTSQEERKKIERQYDEIQKKAAQAELALANVKRKISETNSPLKDILDKLGPEQSASRQPENPSGKALPTHPQKTKFRTDAPIYSRYTKQEKKLIGKIYASIGNAVADERQREALISKIEEDITR